MSAEAKSFLESLRQRGADVRLEGDQVCCVPKPGSGCTFTADDETRLRRLKPALVPLLSPSAADPLGEAVAVEKRETLGAVRLRSRFGELWIAIEPGTFDALVAEERTRGCAARPVLHLLDVLALRGRSDAAIRAVFEIARAFPGARLEPQ
jgi:hypothetical protein